VEIGQDTLLQSFFLLRDPSGFALRMTTLCHPEPKAKDPVWRKVSHAAIDSINR